MRGQQPGMPQPHSWQQSGFSDVQLLQQHFMFKQLQEFQRQQQLQQQGDARQQNSINQLSAITKQVSGGPCPPMINGAPIHDTSQMFMNRVQHVVSPTVQGVPDGLMFSQEQGHALRLMDRVSQQLDVSFYGTPIASARGNLSQYSHLQGISNDHANLLTKASGNQTQKPVMQSSAFSNSFLGEQCTVSPDQVCMTSGAFITKQGFQGKNLFGQVPIQGLNSENLLDNFQHTLQKNASVQEFNGRQERAGWPVFSQEKATQISPSQGLTTLDPLEEKILFNMDDNIWDASFSRHTESGTGNFGNTLEHTDYLNAFPSIQSGSWSALMQSAVAEASSSDTGLQEEWSGLTFQNMELSADNQPSNFMDSGKQQAGCVDSNLQSASSLNSKPFAVLSDSNMSTGFPGFQHSGIQFSSEQREGLQQGSSHESIQPSPKNPTNWLDCNSQQTPPIEEKQQFQPLVQLENAWTSQTNEHSGSDAHQHSTSSYNQQRNKTNGRNVDSVSPRGNATLNIRNDENTVDNCWAGDINVAMYKERDPNGCLWKTDANHGPNFFSNSADELAQIQSRTDNIFVKREDSQMHKFVTVPKSSTPKADRETSQQVQGSHLVDWRKRGDVSVEHRENESMGNDQHELNNGPQVLDNSYNGVGEAYEKRQNRYHRENSNDSYNSIASQHKISRHEVRDNAWSNATDSQPLAKSCQNSSGQVGLKASTSHKYLYHPTENLGARIEFSDSVKHITPSHVQCQQLSQGLSSCEQGYFRQSKLITNVSNSTMELEKQEHFTEFHGNSKGSEDVPSIGNLGSNISASFDKLVGFYGPNITAQTSQNILELLQKVDHSREDSSVTHFGSADCNPLSKVSKAETPDAYVARLYNHSPASQGFGLRLAPPSQRLPNSNPLFSSQSSPQTVSNLNSRHEKGQTWLAPPSSVQSLPPMHESSERERWDEKSGISGRTDIRTSRLNMQGISPGAFTSGSPYLQSQLHGQHISKAPVASQSSQATLPGTASRLPPFNLAPSQDTSGPICVNSFGQQFPIMEAVPVTKASVVSAMSRQGGLSTRPHNVWTNIPTQRLSSGAEPHKVSSTNPSNNSLETTLCASQELNDQNSQNGGNGSLEFGACSTNQQGFDCGEEQLGKERSQQQISCEILHPASQTGGLSQGHGYVAKHLSDATATASGSSMAQLYQQDINRVRHGDNKAPASSMKDLEAFGHSLKPSHVFHPNYSLLHQVQARKNVESDPSKGVSMQYSVGDGDSDVKQVTAAVGEQSLYRHDTRVRNPMDNGLNASSRLNSFPSGDAKIMSFLSEAREDNTLKASPQPVLRNIASQEMVPFGRSDSSHSGSSNAASGRTDHSQISLQMANSWFRQYGNFKNGQILPMYDARTAKASAERFSLGKPSEKFPIHTSMERVDAADTSQVNSVWASTPATLVANEHFSTPYVLPSVNTDQSLAVMGPKKRKTASELLPWHKEVTQGSQSLQNISMAELEWAQATNRVIEKVEDDAELFEDGQPLLRPKKRLILTTQLMQQLLGPAPATILSADATSDYDSVAYFVAKVAVGDACSLTSCPISDYYVPPVNNNLMSEKLKTSERIGDQYFSKVMEDFTDRTKKLENDLLRLDKRLSVVDIRVECQELEKVSVINRFAKFHIRGQADAAETSSSSGTAATATKMFPQRYVTALPMPGKLPEGIQCLSL